MNVAVCYVFPQVNPKLYEPCAKRFASQYCEFPPGETDHTLHVICNGGGRLTERQKDLFSPLVPEFFYHDNSGKDVGGYAAFSRQTDADMIMCIGAPGRPRVAGWLDYMVFAFQDHGPGIFGPWAFGVPQPHIRTTIFAISPYVLNDYPMVVDNGHRYEFEHGSNSITRHCMRKGFAALQVTLRGVFGVDRFHPVPVQESIFADQHTDKHA